MESSKISKTLHTLSKIEVTQAPSFDFDQQSLVEIRDIAKRLEKKFKEQISTVQQGRKQSVASNASEKKSQAVATTTAASSNQYNLPPNFDKTREKVLIKMIELTLSNKKDIAILE